MSSWELTNDLIGEAEWQNGIRTVYIPVFTAQLGTAAELEGRTACSAAELVSAAARACTGCTRDAAA